MKSHAPIALANEASDRIALVCLSNEIGSDGWARVATYGEHLQTRVFLDETGRTIQQRYLQVVDRAGAEALANSFNSVGRRIKRALFCVPLYVRHPDLAVVHPGDIGNSKAPLAAVGSINRLEAREDGLYALTGLFDSGRIAVENEGLKYISIFWWVKPTGETRGDAIVTTPSEVISGGLTDTPNIAGTQALANQRSATTTTTTDPDPMKHLLIGWLAAQGIALANDASDQSVFDSFRTHYEAKTSNLAALGNEKSTLTTKVSVLETDKTAVANELATVKTTLATAQTDLATANTALANERKAKHEAIVDLAIGTGRLAVADRDAKILALANAKDAAAFDTEVKALKEAPVKFRVAAANEGARRADAANTKTQPARDQIIALANSDPRYKEIKNAVDAIAAVRRDNPALAQLELAEAPNAQA